MSEARRILLSVENVSLSFGGVQGDRRRVVRHPQAARSAPSSARTAPARRRCSTSSTASTTRRRAGSRFSGQARSRMRPHEAAAQGIARTFQNVALFKGMTTLDNIMTGRGLRMQRGLFWQALRHGPALAEEIEHRKFCEEIIDFLEIEAIRKTPVGALPYGLQKRVELGRALAMEPKLLLLDEPMAGMNREEKEDMSRFIVDANREFGATIALIEHDIGVVMDLSDRVVVLEYGRKIADGTARRGARRDRAVIDRLSRRARIEVGAAHEPALRHLRRSLRADGRPRPTCSRRRSGRASSAACSMR